MNNSFFERAVFGKKNITILPYAFFAELGNGRKSIITIIFVVAAKDTAEPRGLFGLVKKFIKKD